MHKLWLLAVIAITAILSVSVIAEDLCSDTDDGPAETRSPSKAVLSTKGSVKYGVSTLQDTCITGDNGISAVNSTWLREYYCSSDKREHEDYDCTKYGFTGCSNGACVGGTAQQNQTNQTTKKQSTSSCGDKHIDSKLGETCDPPGSVCFGKTIGEYGQCDNSCKCKFVHKSENQSRCGNSVVESGEECEINDDCSSGKKCEFCTCVTEQTNATTNVTTNATTNVTTTNVTTAKNETNATNETYKIPEITIPELGNVTNFSEEPGIKASRGVSNFFMKIWNWVFGLFQ